MDINRYIGIPYKDRGRDVSGADCWGLVRMIYQDELQITLPSYDGDYLSSEEAEEIGRLVNRERGSWREIPRGEEQEGDIIVLRLMRCPMHVGVIYKPGMMIHLLRGCNAVAEAYTSRLWTNRIHCILRHEGMP